MPETFDYNTFDRAGQRPNKNAIGSRIRHTGNQKIFTIMGFAWDGSTDLWHFLHVGPDGITITRPLEHLTGARSDGAARYEVIAYG